jgi:hypothetical protein
MSAAQLRTLRRRLVISFGAAILIAARAKHTHALFVAAVLPFAIAGLWSDAKAQDVFDPSSQFGPFVHQATLPASGLVGSAGNTVVTAAGGAVVVFERDAETDAWRQVGLTPSDSPANFGRLLYFDETTVIVGADDAVYVFAREHEAWRELGKLVPSGSAANFGRTLAFDGTTAIAGADGAAYAFVLENDAWRELTKLVASDGVADFGRALAFDGRTLIVGAADAAYVFVREGDSWTESAKLVPSDGVAGFGGSVGLRGTLATVEVAGPLGGVYIFMADPEVPEVWNEVVKLEPPEPVLDVRGGSLIADETAIIRAQKTPEHGALYIFDRHEGGSDNWGLVRWFPRFHFLRRVMPVADDTLIVGGGELQGYVHIFARNAGGPNAWGLAASLGGSENPIGPVGDFRISGQRLIATNMFTNWVDVFDENEDGPRRWGRVSSLIPNIAPSGERPRIAPFVNDTVLVEFSPSVGVAVMVSDLDRDGLRDGRDLCPRDPLNNVAGGCTRNSTAHPVHDDLIALGDVATESRDDEFLITATFTNTSDTAIGNPFFEIAELTQGNLLLNADAGTGGVGATLSPDVGDGILSPGESTTVTFRIRLQTREPFQFFVAFHGEPVS